MIFVMERESQGRGREALKIELKGGCGNEVAPERLSRSLPLTHASLHPSYHLIQPSYAPPFSIPSSHPKLPPSAE